MTSVKKIKVALLALVAALVIAIPTSAFAASITVTADEKMVDASYKAYQIFAGRYAPAEGETKATLSDVQWGPDVNVEDAGFAAAIEGVLGTSKPAEAAEALNDDNALAFAAAIEKYLVGGTELQSTDGLTFSASDLADGYWLVKTEEPGKTEDGREGAYTKFVTGLIGGSDDINRAAKASVPEVDKGVLEDSTENFDQIVAAGDISKYHRAADFDYEQTIPYFIKGTLPTKYDEFTKGYYYKFTDKMSEGLKLVGNDTSSVHVYKYENGVQGDEITSGVTKTWNEDANTLTVEFANLKTVIPSYVEGLEIVVLYEAQLTGNAVKFGVDGNPNEVYLTYSNNPNKDGFGEPDNTGDTPRKYAIVYTFGVEETKHKDGDTSTTLAGAKFKLKNEAGQYAVIEFSDATKKNAGKFLRWDTEANGTVLVTEADGKLNIKYLDADTYYFVETEAPVGYNMPTDPNFKVEVKSSLPADTEVQAKSGNIKCAAEVNADGYSHVDISNTQGSTLPSTGGIGTTIFTIVGIALIIAAVAIMVVRRRNATTA